MTLWTLLRQCSPRTQYSPLAARRSSSSSPPPPPSSLRLYAGASLMQVLFTDNEELIDREAAHVYNQSDIEGQLVVFDNGRRMGGAAVDADAPRPMTAAVGLR